MLEVMIAEMYFVWDAHVSNICFLDFFLIVVTTADVTPPVIQDCPQPLTYTIPVGTTTRVVSWLEPIATDDSGIPPTRGRSHRPGDTFSIGSTEVMYTFTDQAGNTAMCSFLITISK